MTLLEHRKRYGNDYDNMVEKWVRTISRVYYVNINKCFNELNIKMKSKKINLEEIENIHGKVIEVIEKVYSEINMEIIFKEIEQLYDFIKNDAESSFFNDINNNGHIKYELKNMLENFLNNKQMFYDKYIDIYNKALHLYTTLEIINGYYETFDVFFDLIDDILSDMYPDYRENLEEYLK